jgi:phosphatidylglycerol---prolipoprotein diacylglyceryl transferase
MSRRPVIGCGRIHVPAYTVLLYLGLLAGTYTAFGAARADGLRDQEVGPAILLLVAVAVLGARLAFVAGRWSVFRRAPGRILARNEGGAVAYGALLAVPMSVPLLAALGIPLAAFWDAGALGFLAAIVFLRIGCLLNGCCSGKVCDGRFGVELRNAAGVRARRIPNQLLEAGLAAALLAGGAVALGRMPFAGALFLTLLASYALGRFMLEFTREGSKRLGRLTVAQSFSAAFVLVALVAFASVLVAGVGSAW